LENKHGLKAGTGKTEDISSPKVESAAQLESKATCSVNAFSNTFQPLSGKAQVSKTRRKSCIRGDGSRA